MSVKNPQRHSFVEWCRRGEPMIWFNAAAVSISAIAVRPALPGRAPRAGYFGPGVPSKCFSRLSQQSI